VTADVLFWIAVAPVGALGALARFTLDGAVQRRVSAAFPLGTLAVNLTGAFALGLLIGLGASGRGEELLGAAFLGSYTTFSTWMLETRRLLEDGDLLGAALNVFGSLAWGIAAAGVGWWLGSVIR
jgi:fluoride exporter